MIKYNLSNNNKKLILSLTIIIYHNKITIIGENGIKISFSFQMQNN